MKTFKKMALAAVAVAVAGITVGCATGPTAEELDRDAVAVIRSAFRDEGLVKVDRLNQDFANEACSKAQGKDLPADVTRAIEAANLKTIKAPSDGQYLGDWKQGEAIAQSGRGLTYTDDARTVNGGNCYNCHQIDQKEISFGTIGPSLYNFGKQRGVSDPSSPVSKGMVEYTWGKIWNAKAYNACSNMPRAGHMGIMTEAQVADLVALLLDPKSPVNQ